MTNSDVMFCTSPSFKSVVIVLLVFWKCDYFFLFRIGLWPVSYSVYFAFLFVSYLGERGVLCVGNGPYEYVQYNVSGP